MGMNGLSVYITITTRRYTNNNYHFEYNVFIGLAGQLASEIPLRHNVHNRTSTVT